MIDYRSQQRTVQYIQDLIDASDVRIGKIVVVDNSPEEDNYAQMLSQLKKIGAENFHTIAAEAFAGIQTLTIADFHKTQLILVNSKNNSGFAKSNNMGLALIRHFDSEHTIKYVLFSNSDIQFTQDKLLLSVLINDLNQHQDAGLIGPKVIGLDGKQQSPCGYLSLYQRWLRTCILWPLNLKWKQKISELTEASELSAVYRIIGAFMLADVERFHLIGGFDETTFLYAEELILAERLKKVGMKVYCDPKVVIIHEGGHTVGSLKNPEARNRKLKNMFTSDIYYYEKYRGVSSAFCRFAKHMFAFYIWKLNAKDSILNWFGGKKHG